MTMLSLSQRDVNVLEKIKDPESDPTLAQLMDSSLPKDPHLTDQVEYEVISRQEQQIVREIQHLEMQLAGLQPKHSVHPVEQYRQCRERLGNLISEHPKYASARNNRAQALRRLYGDSIIVRGESNENGPQEALMPRASDSEKTEAAQLALSDLDKAISLLSPAPFAPMSPQAARTLSLAHTQRAALYLKTAKLLSQNKGRGVVVGDDRPESKWSSAEFAEAASRDFALGGRYGNDIAKALAVGTNPTAKLCGQMVREAMKKEYGEGYGG
jgi:hypothetical protein